MTVSVEPTSVDPRQNGSAAEAEVLRAHAEDAFAAELAALAVQDDRPRPARWKLSPWAVATYLLARPGSPR
ncbi:ATPase, partial [Streptomyces hirsutus]